MPGLVNPVPSDKFRTSNHSGWKVLLCKMPAEEIVHYMPKTFATHRSNLPDVIQTKRDPANSTSINVFLSYQSVYCSSHYLISLQVRKIHGS
jgi:hypothetical protein